MDGIEQVNEAELGAMLRGGGPVLLLFSDGSGTRGEFLTQFRNSANESTDIIFAQCNPYDNPDAASRFKIGSKPVLLGIHGGEAITRSARPWASDVKLALGAVREAERAAQPETATAAADTASANASDRPLAVTDDSFQRDVLDSALPVLVDFWAGMVRALPDGGADIGSIGARIRRSLADCQGGCGRQPGAGAAISGDQHPDDDGFCRWAIAFQPGRRPAGDYPAADLWSAGRIRRATFGAASRRRRPASALPYQPRNAPMWIESLAVAGLIVVLRAGNHTVSTMKMLAVVRHRKLLAAALGALEALIFAYVFSQVSRRYEQLGDSGGPTVLARRWASISV